MSTETSTFCAVLLEKDSPTLLSIEIFSLEKRVLLSTVILSFSKRTHDCTVEVQSWCCILEHKSVLHLQNMIWATQLQLF